MDKEKQFIAISWYLVEFYGSICLGVAVTEWLTISIICWLIDVTSGRTKQ